MRKSNPKHNRTRYVRLLCNRIIEKIYHRQLTNQQEILYQIANENQQLLNCSLATFMFEGEWYPIPMPISFIQKETPNTVLHESLREKVDHVINQQTFTQKTDEVHITFLVQNSVAKARCFDDLYRLLPNMVPNALYDDIVLFDIGDPLTNEEIDAIKEENKLGTLCLNKMLIRDLLLYK